MQQRRLNENLFRSIYNKWDDVVKEDADGWLG